MKDGYVYLASPYSDPEEVIRTRRFWAVCAVTAHLMRDGHIVYSPIAHSHPVALCGGLPTEWDFWARFDETMLHAARELWVLTLPGWDNSRGVKAEIRIAQRLEKPIKQLSWPGRPRVELRDLEPFVGSHLGEVAAHG